MAKYNVLVLMLVAVVLTSFTDADEDACGDAPCQNGGMCMNADTDASCDCPYSFTGEYCESVLTTGDACIRSCEGKEDGNYQNCRRCGIFVNCTDEKLEEDFCVEGEEWHEADKMCKNGSSGTCQLEIVSPSEIGPCAAENVCKNGGTCENYEDLVSYYCDCPYSYTGDHCESVITTGDACVRSCKGKEDGNYQNCRRCSIFVNCTNENLEEGFCDDNQEWHEEEGMCKNGSSSTCEKKVVSASDVGPCAANNPCENGGTCVNGQDWLDSSCDCPYSYTGDKCESMLSTGDDCVRSCEDVNDGDYQNCRRCSIYTVCLGGELTEGFCPEGQGWDNTADSCKEDPAGDCELKKVEAGSAIATAPGVLAILLGLGFSVISALSTF